MWNDPIAIQKSTPDSKNLVILEIWCRFDTCWSLTGKNPEHAWKHDSVQLTNFCVCTAHGALAKDKETNELLSQFAWHNLLLFYHRSCRVPTVVNFRWCRRRDGSVSRRQCYHCVRTIRYIFLLLQKWEVETEEKGFCYCKRSRQRIAEFNFSCGLWFRDQSLFEQHRNWYTTEWNKNTWRNPILI